MDIQQFIDDNKAWTDETFGKLSTLSVMKHLRKEVDEVVEALEHQQTFGGEGAALLEFADLYLLFLNSLAQEGIKFEELHRAAVNKMAINRKRKWERQEGGFFEHTTIVPHLTTNTPHEELGNLLEVVGDSEELIQAYKNDPACKHITKFAGKIVETKTGKVGIIRNSDKMHEGKYKVYTKDGNVLCDTTSIKLCGFFD